MAKKTKMQKRMAHARKFRGKGKKSTTKKPVVVVAVPRNAKLIIKRKASNPYMFETFDDGHGHVSRRDIQHTSEYRGQM